MTGTGTITNDDSAQFNIAGNAGLENGGTITFTVTLTNPVDVATAVNVSTVNGTATTGDSDYTAVTNQTLNFAAGIVTQTFTVTPTADSKVEGDAWLLQRTGKVALCR